MAKKSCDLLMYCTSDQGGGPKTGGRASNVLKAKARAAIIAKAKARAAKAAAKPWLTYV